MLTAIDHIIIGVRDLEAAAARFAQNLGLLPGGGGIHPSRGTANRIIVIGDTYLELIAVRVPAEAQQSMVERLAKGEGYLNVVLASDNIEAEGKAMRERGVSIIGPTPGELRSHDGRSRAWSRIDVEQPFLAQHYPFLIQHDSAGEERRYRLAGWTTPPEHPLGVTQVLSATIAVADLQEASRRFSHIYGLTPSEPFTGDSDGWDAMLVSFPLGRGGQHLELAAPMSLAAEEDQEIDMQHLPEAGALARHLAQFGESVCRMTLAVTSLAEALRFLDAHGVTYTFSQEDTHPALWIHPDYASGASIVLHERPDALEAAMAMQAETVARPRTIDSFFLLILYQESYLALEHLLEQVGLLAGMVQLIVQVGQRAHPDRKHPPFLVAQFRIGRDSLHAPIVTVVQRIGNAQQSSQGRDPLARLAAQRSILLVLRAGQGAPVVARNRRDFVSRLVIKIGQRGAFDEAKRVFMMAPHLDQHARIMQQRGALKQLQRLAIQRVQRLCRLEQLRREPGDLAGVRPIFYLQSPAQTQLFLCWLR